MNIFFPIDEPVVLRVHGDDIVRDPCQTPFCRQAVDPLHGAPGAIREGPRGRENVAVSLAMKLFRRAGPM